MMDMFGLLERDIEYLHKAFTQCTEIEKVIIFGSRAMGNYKKGSDVDIVVVGENITRRTIYALHDLLNEQYPLPYFFDILNYDEISNSNLLDHIQNVGQVLYKREK